MGRGKVHVIVGGQWGSEAKGLACEYFAKTRKYAAAVRTGAINAGHTVYNKGRAYAMCQLPVAWVNKDITLVVGGGAYIEEEVMKKEIEWIKEAQSEAVLAHRIVVDKRAYSHLHAFADKEQGMHERMGSTAHGVGEAIIDKIGRKSTGNLFRESEYAKSKNNIDFLLADTQALLSAFLETGQDVMVEGTQGTLLDFHYGIEYPYCTSRQTIASAWLAEAGLPPKNVEVTMVVRAMPIRVAGNSGPLPGETDWYSLVKATNEKLMEVGKEPIVSPDLLELFHATELKVAQEMGLPGLPHEVVDPALRAQFSTELSSFHSTVLSRFTAEEIAELKKMIELTTVTKKVRRIAEIDADSLVYASTLNAPDNIFLNFLNYVFPEIWGVTSWDEVDKDTMLRVKSYINSISQMADAPVKWVSTGPQSVLEV